MEEQAKAFGKKGRPTEDPVARRLEIFRAVAPVLKTRGAKLSVREAAEAAFISVGGLYHYFPTKRDLLLYGLNPEPATLICAEFERVCGSLKQSDFDAYKRELVELIVATVEQMKASVDAAITLGIHAVRSGLDGVVQGPAPGFAELLRGLYPDGQDVRQQSLETAVRSIIGAALFAEETSGGELRVRLAAEIEAWTS